MITLSANAVAYVKRQMQKQGGLGILVGALRSGCSGWRYAVEPLVSPDETMLLSEQDGITIALTKEAAALLIGTQIDVKKEGLNERFVFHNPRAEGTCGCGMSFSVNQEA